MIGRHVDELIDGFLLGALDGSEAAAVRGHLRGCAACTRTLLEAREVLSVLPEQIDELSPRASVKTAVMAVVRADAPRKAAMPRSRERGAGRLLPFRMDLSSSNPLLRWASLGMAAAFIIGVVGGVTGWALILGDRLQKKSDDLTRSEGTIETLIDSKRTVRMESTYAGATVKAIVAAPETGTGNVVVVRDLPRATGGNGYIVWLWDDGTPTSGGIIQPDASGDAVWPLDLDLSPYERMEIDLQPVGATAPGGDRVLAGALR